MKKEKLPTKRIRVLVAIMVLWGVGIAARLYFLQVVQSKTYIEKAAQHQQDIVKTTPRRGDILDRDGSVLATSLKAYSVFAKPIEMKNPAAVAKELARLTGLPAKDLVRKLQPSRRWLFVKRKISDDERKAIERAKLPGVGFQPEFRRYYPLRHMAAHLLGYVDVDEEGKTGLEGKYNTLVRGEPGEVLWLRDALGNSYQREQRVPEVGSTLTTTIDRNIQFILEKEISAAAETTHASAISIVAMDPNSGAILGMANYPTFNPNDYKQSPQSAWSQNPSVALTYEPGSTFKMVTVAAALEEGLTTPDEQMYCGNGSIVVHKRTIKDHKPYGMLSVRQVMQNSSNVCTIKLGMRVGEERLKGYIDRYGFGEKTRIDLPAEVGGTVHETRDWTKTSIASVSMGHEITVTPLQIAMMISTVANGGIQYKPYVVQKIEDPQGKVTEIKPTGTRVISLTTAQQLREMLEDVVEDGTAKTSKLEGYRAAGKTGTAQKVDPATGRYSHTKYIGSFAGFAPVTSPKIAIVVVIDEPKGKYYGGEIAAPVFKRIAEQVLRMKSVVPDVPHYAPQYTITPEKPKERSTPAGTKEPGFKVMDAALRPSQSRQASEIIVPDYTGQSLRQAVDDSSKLGLEPRPSGSGRVVGQSPSPGAHVPPGTRIRFKLSLR